ncbi:MAG: DNA polymerase, partial [Gammaproteobacteria bacterium]|nr:DNA polymerase [Gammaproteobacteria bacterium]
MRRSAHRLKQNSAETRPEHVLFFDTETYPRRESPTGTRQDFHLGVAHYWRKRRDGKPDNHEWLHFTDIASFWTWTLKKVHTNSILYLVAHNLAFDAQVCRMFVELPERGWRLLFLFENGDTRLIRWGLPTTKLAAWLAEGQHITDFEGKRWSKTVLAMDDCNLFGGSIERWGKALQFPKLKMPAYDAPDEEWWTYCQRDVEVMVRLWQEWFTFLDEQELGTFRTTIGSQAFAGFRHAYMHNRIEIHDNEDAIALERESYRGGRSEAFWVGRRDDGPFYKLDVNSMYPTVMYENTFPTQLQRTGERLTVSRLRSLVKSTGVIATVSLDVDVPVYPIQVNGKNVYPVGQFSTVLCTPEIRTALDNGWIVDVGAFATYRMRRLFYWYVDHFYALKVECDRNGDKLHRSLVKLLLNSLYGKFGQMGYEDRIIGTCAIDDIQVEYGMRFPSRQRITIYRAGGTVIESARTGEGFNSSVAIASHVS